jgi:hypothetical protein
VTGDGSRLTRGSKRLKTTAATAQGPHRGLRCNAKPRNQPVKVTWFRLCFDFSLSLSPLCIAILDVRYRQSIWI